MAELGTFPPNNGNLVPESPRHSASAKPLVGVIMGSRSDWETMQHAVQTLVDLGIPHEARVVSAHRTPDLLFDYAEAAVGRGLKVIIAGAGGAAHLAGVLAAATPLPVIAVPVPLANLQGLDSLLSMVQMPSGIPVATVAIAGGRNAGLLAVRILAATDDALRARVEQFQRDLAASVREKDAKVRAEFS